LWNFSWCSLNNLCSKKRRSRRFERSRFTYDRSYAYATQNVNWL
jgi:hypothetical protein